MYMNKPPRVAQAHSPYDADADDADADDADADADAQRVAVTGGGPQKAILNTR